MIRNKNWTQQTRLLLNPFNFCSNYKNLLILLWILHRNLNDLHLMLILAQMVLLLIGLSVQSSSLSQTICDSLTILLRFARFGILGLFIINTAVGLGALVKLLAFRRACKGCPRINLVDFDFGRVDNLSPFHK